MAMLASMVTIVPTPRAVSSLAPLILCPVNIIPKGGSNGHFNHADPDRDNVSSLYLANTSTNVH